MFLLKLISQNYRCVEAGSMDQLFQLLYKSGCVLEEFAEILVKAIAVVKQKFDLRYDNVVGKIINIRFQFSLKVLKNIDDDRLLSFGKV